MISQGAQLKLHGQILLGQFLLLHWQRALVLESFHKRGLRSIRRFEL